MKKKLPILAAEAAGAKKKIKINKEVLPYFKVWYQRKKLDGETEDQFILRFLNQAAVNDYMSDVAQAGSNAIEAERVSSITELNAEIREITNKLVNG